MMISLEASDSLDVYSFEIHTSLVLGIGPSKRTKNSNAGQSDVENISGDV